MEEKKEMSVIFEEFVYRTYTIAQAIEECQEEAAENIHRLQGAQRERKEVSRQAIQDLLKILA